MARFNLILVLLAKYGNKFWLLSSTLKHLSWSHDQKTWVEWYSGFLSMSKTIFFVLFWKFGYLGIYLPYLLICKIVYEWGMLIVLSFCSLNVFRGDYKIAKWLSKGHPRCPVSATLHVEWIVHLKLKNADIFLQGKLYRQYTFFMSPNLSLKHPVARKFSFFNILLLLAYHLWPSVEDWHKASAC